MPSPLRTKRFSRAVISLVPLLVRPILHIITPDDGDDYTAAVRGVGSMWPESGRSYFAKCNSSAARRQCARAPVVGYGVNAACPTQNVQFVPFSLFSELRGGHRVSPI